MADDLDPVPFVWPSGVRSMFTRGDGIDLDFAPRAGYEQDPVLYPLSDGTTVADLLEARRG